MQRKSIPYLVRVWVPKLKVPIVERELNSLMAAAGGATAIPSTGYWLDGDKSTIVEPVWVYEFAYTDADWQVEPGAYHLAQSLLDAGEQSVLIEINGRRVLLTP